MSLKYNLQFFADGPGGEKTEPATQKKLSDARKKGQVAKSREVANAFGLLALFLLIKLWVGSLGIQFLELFNLTYNKIPEMVIQWNGFLSYKDIISMLQNMIIQVVILLAPAFIVAFAVSFISEIMQVKWEMSPEALKPKFSKLSPISGFKRIFSANSIVELIKSLAKIFLIGYICYDYVVKNQERLFILYDTPLLQAVQMVADMVVSMGIRITLVYMVLALADFVYQKFKFNKDMRMTKQEVKDEYKQQEGDPKVKGRIRQKMQEVSRRRMMQSLPTADVVITNPTHYAVAIKYDPEVADAPLVLAKGADYLAAKIKEVAKENKIEIVENKPLARMLYANVEVGQAVPPELYQAVAEVLAYVYKLQGRI